jgi:type VI secretion system secreted protein VgrG
MPTFATLNAPALGDDLRVAAFQGTEALCRPYRFDVHVMVSGGASVDLAEVVGERATLTLQRESGQAFTYHGVLASVRLLVQTGEWALYQATLVPLLWRLGQSRHSNAFTKLSVPDLIHKVLTDSSLTSNDFELRLDGNYAVEELIVQYQESNLDFLHRWMEHEGLYYYFEQGEETEKLVIVDHRSFHDKLVDKKIRYSPMVDHNSSAGECFDNFMAVHNATVERVRMTDYDYARPALDVSAQTDVSTRGFGELSIHGGRFFDPEDAKRFARLRGEELKAREVTYHAAGSALHVSAGYLVELEEHPADAYNKKYLVTEVQHFGNQLAQGDALGIGRWIKPPHEELYRVEAAAVDASLQYRAPLTTTWPRVWGFENGVIDGPVESQYAQIDEQGRYLLKFHFDESDLDGGKASTYVRMMQPHGGTTEGFHFPLRKGTEVVLTFLGGDPDRPVIAGVVPNATTPSPITKDNNTKNRLITGSGSHLTIDDAQGKEYIHIHSPKLTEMFMGGPTDKHADQHTNKQVRTPPTDKATPGADDTGRYESKSYTWYTYTDGSAGFFIDGDWRQDVGGGIYIYGNDVLNEYYKGPHILNIDGSSTKYYNDHLKVQVAAGEDRDVTGLWDLDATTKVKIHTPAYQLDADNTLTATTKEGTLTFSSKATCNFGETKVTAGKTNLTFGATTVDIGATTGKIAKVELTIGGGAKITTPKWEVVDPDESWVGAISEWKWAKKMEFTALSIGATGLKMEGTGVSIGMTGLKMENKAGELKKVGAALWSGGPKAAARALKSELAGFFTFT